MLGRKRIFIKLFITAYLEDLQLKPFKFITGVLEYKDIIYYFDLKYLFGKKTNF